MSTPELRRELRDLLQAMLGDLAQIHSTVTVVVAALRHQASGHDEDMATVLMRGAGDLVQEQLDRIDQALRKLDALE